MTRSTRFSRRHRCKNAEFMTRRLREWLLRFSHDSSLGPLSGSLAFVRDQAIRGPSSYRVLALGSNYLGARPQSDLMGGIYPYSPSQVFDGEVDLLVGHHLADALSPLFEIDAFHTTTLFEFDARGGAPDKPWSYRSSILRRASYLGRDGVRQLPAHMSEGSP